MAAWEPPALIAWLRRLAPRADSLGPFELLELEPTDDLATIRAAYHAIAATRHPDLFRGRLGAPEAELLMRLFAKVSGAYALLRDPEERVKHGAKRTPAAAAAPAAAARKIAPRAMSHVRRADAALDTGDVAAAILHLRMAVASDPGSRELRALLADAEARLKK